MGINKRNILMLNWLRRLFIVIISVIRSFNKLLGNAPQESALKTHTRAELISETPVGYYALPQLAGALLHMLIYLGYVLAHFDTIISILPSAIAAGGQRLNWPNLPIRHSTRRRSHVERATAIHFSFHLSSTGNPIRSFVLFIAKRQ